MMNDLISRQALCEYALNQKDKSVTPNDIMRFPSAQPEIVKCKNCKNFRRNIPCVGGVYDGCGKLLDEGNEMPVDENFYCGYAERRTDED